MSNQKLKSPQRSNKGFTLLEVLLVLFIMMILVYQVAPRFTSSESLARVKADSANRQRIEGAVELYTLDTGEIPGSIEDLISPATEVRGWSGPYLDQVLVNPMKGALPYELDAQGKVRTTTP